MKAIIKPDARYIVGSKMSLDSMCKLLKQECGFSRKEAEANIKTLVEAGYMVHDDGGYRMLATMPILDSLR
ncbi:hypothetical protein SAMN02910447_03135 [Ruminococcus sp. YE71]|uniref:hypothetical protein n=1 Tax=unclassified Ruminococcus TaxID=2608920 RepID=UPI00088D20DC|nr:MULTISPECIES: hypothetical protein [unclassified Ruminococcus]SDA30026.1 hypothetical protein SAMN02910446_03206 [Ruminococcus sp. YE78]SFW49100.1 hypothetical protein SAMN02910447_03135 [Ruminococcus sp. YE71]